LFFYLLLQFVLFYRFLICCGSTGGCCSYLYANVNKQLISFEPLYSQIVDAVLRKIVFISALEYDIAESVDGKEEEGINSTIPTVGLEELQEKLAG